VFVNVNVTCRAQVQRKPNTVSTDTVEPLFTTYTNQHQKQIIHFNIMMLSSAHVSI